MRDKNNHSPIKLAAFDLDGTLLNSEKELSAENLAAIEAALDQGVTIAIATGRTNRGLPKPLRENERIRYAICANGAAVVDLRAETVLYQQYLPLSTVEKVMAIIEPFDLSIDILSDGKIITEERNRSRIFTFVIPENMHSYIRNTRTWIPDMKEYILQNPDRLEKINLFFHSMEQREEVRRILSDVAEIAVTSSLSTNLELNQSKANKGAALGWLAQYLGLSCDEVMACGDSENDIKMLAAAGLSVAMGNGSEEVKEIADVITLTNDQSGVADAIRKYILT